MFWPPFVCLRLSVCLWTAQLKKWRVNSRGIWEIARLYVGHTQSWFSFGIKVRPIGVKVRVAYTVTEVCSLPSAESRLSSGLSAVPCFDVVRHEAGRSAALPCRSDGALARLDSEASSAGRRPWTRPWPVSSRPPRRRRWRPGRVGLSASLGARQRTACRPSSSRQVANWMPTHAAAAADVPPSFVCAARFSICYAAALGQALSGAVDRLRRSDQPLTSRRNFLPTLFGLM